MILIFDIDDDYFTVGLCRNYFKESDVYLAEGCNLKCKFNLLCSLVTTNVADQSHCLKVKKKLVGHEEF